MVEQAPRFHDNTNASQPVAQSEAHSAAQKMLHCVELHNRSTTRDGADKRTNDGAVVTDQQSIDIALKNEGANIKILELLSANKPISSELRERAINLHLQSRDLNNADTIGDIAAQTKDISDAKEEQKVINSDRRLLRDSNLSSFVREQLQEDVSAKLQLQKNEKQDIPGERAYVAADDNDSKMNKLVIDALTTNSPQLAALLMADNASKSQIIGMRGDDKRLEPSYSAADIRDQATNNLLIEALKTDPYLSAVRRQEANLPVYSTEEQLSQAEQLQHERRRLHLPANATARQLNFAEEADMNKQIDLPSWATKEQRTAARAVKHRHHTLPEHNPTELN